MRYKLLGNSGLRVSELALGAMTFGPETGFGVDKDESRRVYDAFRDAGGNFIDTANIYAAGVSEQYLGDFMGRDRPQHRARNEVHRTDARPRRERRRQLAQEHDGLGARQSAAIEDRLHRSVLGARARLI